jgi:peptidyl-prolyl cis-trans isomerase B (cyclophilin B)
VHVPSNEQRRANAKRKLERQMVNRQERAIRKRKTILISSVVTVAVVVAGTFLVMAKISQDKADAAAAAAALLPKTTTGACKYVENKTEPAPAGKKVGLPDDPATVSKTTKQLVNFETNLGTLPITFDASLGSPCAVQSEIFLAKKGFYDNTIFHRLTNYDTALVPANTAEEVAATPASKLLVLQGGDPKGTGEGGPGYTIKDENPTKLVAAPTSDGYTSADGYKVYKRGTVAMANANNAQTGTANTTGSQFFIVYQDTYLPASYDVVGTISDAGLAVVDKVAAGGITPSVDSSTGTSNPNSGAPKLAITVKKAVLAS